MIRTVLDRFKRRRQPRKRHHGHRRSFFDRARDGIASFFEVVIPGLGLLLLAAAFIAAVGIVIMLLWNYLMPDIFGLPEINVLKALGLLALARILFGEAVEIRR